ncbi:tyrosine-protein phosphatase [Nocardioides dongkuii]|uniref:tyrosine-protein phosphatase n=1 Tax=Nocardioides dongkuii TaxID=2760089 RepID=UPI0015F9B9C6|nr:tyrosine-protein phosphatase [Nocardioides dongkuii]
MTSERFAEELVRLASADNFRDVAGTGAGHPTVDGGRVRRGVFFRANELRLTDADAATIADLGVTCVVDLRSSHEVELHPDVEVPGARWEHVDVLGIPMDQMSSLPDREAAVAMMERVYVGFVEEPATRAALGRVLTILAGEGAHLFHCSAGKDRTGWTAALLLHLAGVADDVIEADYLLTNEYAAASRAAVLDTIVENLGPDKAEVYAPVLVADADYLRTSYAAVRARYGTLDAYLRQGLGLGDDVLGALRAKLR